MIDFHSHILSGIDDGSKNLNETIALIEEAKEAGFTKIITTPHYIDGYYEADQEERTKLISEVKENIRRHRNLYWKRNICNKPNCRINRNKKSINNK